MPQFFGHVVTIVYDYQTLIAGILAVLAAVYATRPVRQQLDQLRLQTYALRRDLVADRIVELAKRRNSTLKPVTELVQELRRPFEFEDQPVINSHWAYDRAGSANSAQQSIMPKAGDSSDLFKGHEKLKESISLLTECLDAIHQPESMLGDGLTEEQMKEIERDALDLEPQLSSRVHKVEHASKALDNAFGDQIVILQKKLAEIDQAITN